MQTTKSALIEDDLAARLEGLRSLSKQLEAHETGLLEGSFYQTPTDKQLDHLRETVLGLADVALEGVENFTRITEGFDDDSVRDLRDVILGEIQVEAQRLLENKDRPEAIWSCGSTAAGVIARIVRASAALENLTCKLAGLPYELSVIADVEESVEMRQAYEKLSRSIPMDPPIDGNYEKPLRAGATAIASLSGKQIFSAVRPADRRAFSDIQNRIRRWLGSRHESESGMHLWQDLVSMRTLLRGINFRAELIQHDLLLIPELLAEVAAMAPDSKPLLDPDFRSRLIRLMGRNPHLDESVQEADRLTAARLLVLLGETEAAMLGSALLPSGTYR